MASGSKSRELPLESMCLSNRGEDICTEDEREGESVFVCVCVCEEGGGRVCERYWMMSIFWTVESQVQVRFTSMSRYSNVSMGAVHMLE